MDDTAIFHRAKKAIDDFIAEGHEGDEMAKFLWYIRHLADTVLEEAMKAVVEENFNVEEDAALE